MSKNKKIIIANWKMNPKTRKDSKKLFLSIKNIASKLKNTQTIICPPYLYINDLIDLYKGHRISIGAQDVFQENKGSFTSMISADMLSGSGVKYVILGHSERRALGENDELVNKKVKSAVKSGLKVILCVGETKRDSHGEYFDFLRDQILNSLKDINKNSFENIFIVYEPVWAISGKSESKSIGPEDLYEMTIFIKKILLDKYGVKNINPNILYGGSVNQKNIESFISGGNVCGVLVGGASLNSEKFNKILKIIDSL